METLVPVTVTGSPELTLSNGEVAVFGRRCKQQSAIHLLGHVRPRHRRPAGDRARFEWRDHCNAWPNVVCRAADLRHGSRSLVTTAADVNNGNADLITANYSSATVSVLLGTGDGTLFKTQQTFATGAGPFPSRRRT